MFRLPSTPFWRSLGLTGLGLGLGACALGTWASGGGVIAIQFGSQGQPTAWASVWVLWGLLLLAVFSLLAASYRRPGPGQVSLSPETSCALFCGLSWLFSLAALTLALYAVWPVPVVFYIGIAAAAAIIPLFLLAAAIRSSRKGS